MMSNISEYYKFADADLYEYGDEDIKSLIDFIKKMQSHNIDLNYHEYSYIVNNITSEWSVRDNHFVRYKMDIIKYIDIMNILSKKYYYAMTKMKYHQLKQKYNNKVNKVKKDTQGGKDYEN